jgi:hypothetical protein
VTGVLRAISATVRSRAFNSRDHENLNWRPQNDPDKALQSLPFTRFFNKLHRFMPHRINASSETTGQSLYSVKY